MDQRTQEWFAARCGKLTASRFAAVMNVLKDGSPGAARKELVTCLAIERLTGSMVEGFQNDAMRRGIELEPEARAAYEAHTGELVEVVGFVPHPELPFVGVSPDGLLGNDGLVELKCPASQHKHMAALLNGEHATEYRWQLQGQLWVTERAWVDAVSYDPRFPEDLRLAVLTVRRDDQAITQLARECARVNDEIERALAQLSQLQQKAA
jgi:putative phage-type endonuclease